MGAAEFKIQTETLSFVNSGEEIAEEIDKCDIT